MASKWHQKKAKQAEIQFERDLQNQKEATISTDKLTSEVAMGGGEAKFYEKKLSKEEKKALAKAKRDAKKKSKKGDDDEDEDEVETTDVVAALDAAKEVVSGLDGSAFTTAGDDGLDHELADKLASEGTICTFSASRKGVDARARDINVEHVTLQHMGSVLLEDAHIVLNHGNRYGLIGRNGCGKSTLLKALGARAIPIPKSIDIFFLKEEVEPSDTLSALDAVMEVDQERLKLEAQSEELNKLLTVVAENPEQLQHSDEPNENGDVKTAEELTEEIMEALNFVYERLDLLDADTAEVRARSILKGLGFTHDMQSKKTKEFSGGWRMRVSLGKMSR
jgi:ATP-binding cassette, subfamily F, member 2